MNLTISLTKIFKMKHILGIGNALVDVMTPINDDEILEKFSLPKGSMQLVDINKSQMLKEGTSKFKITLAPGGSAANTIHGLAMLEAKTGFIGSIGRDDTGDFFENDMKKAGVKTMLLKRDLMTGTAVALISPDSERTFATHLGAAVALGADDLGDAFFKSFQILYLEGYLIINKSFIEKACKLAKENNMKIALDLASYNVVDAKRNDFREIIDNYIDIVFANEEEARSFTGLNPEDAVKEIALHTDISVVKIGKEGSIIMRGDEIVRVGSLQVKSTDTTGAGDLYASGFLYGYANDLPLDKCGVIGSLLAGNVIENVGAKIDNKKWPELRKQVMEIVKE